MCEKILTNKRKHHIANTICICYAILGKFAPIIKQLQTLVQKSNCDLRVMYLNL